MHTIEYINNILFRFNKKIKFYRMIIFSKCEFIYIFKIYINNNNNITIDT